MSWPSNSSGLNREQIVDLNRAFEKSDALLGFEVSDDFVQFDQMNDVFTRAFWDDNVRSEHTDGFFKSHRMAFAPRRGEGFNQKDFALRNASWAVSDIISSRSFDKGEREGFQAPIAYDTPVAPEKVQVEDEAHQTREIKKIAKLFGADLVGITEVDPRWHYSNRVDTRDYSPVPNALPNGITHVIVMGHAMDEDLVDAYPSALASASAGLEYSHEAAIVIQLSAYIRNLGYEAVASMNDTALVIPYAVKAGLGEYGRNQMVITPEFGPRVRFSKIFTNLPLLSDRPEPLGIRQYCEICTQCAQACPPKALPFDAPTDEPQNVSTLGGVKKWSADCEKCFGYWAKLKSDCAICMRVCPFSKTQGMVNRLWQRLARSRFRALARWYDKKRGVPERLKPKDWWEKNSG